MQLTTSIGKITVLACLSLIFRGDDRAGQGRDVVTLGGELPQHPVSLRPVENEIRAAVLPDEQGKRNSVFEYARSQFAVVGLGKVFQVSLEVY